MPPSLNCQYENDRKHQNRTLNILKHGKVRAQYLTLVSDLARRPVLDLSLSIEPERWSNMHMHWPA